MRNLRYRRRPRTITINGHEVPEPLRVKPTNDDTYYIPYLYCPYNESEMYDIFTWSNTDNDMVILESGICHSTKEAAIAHAKALLSFTQKGGEA